MLTHCCASNCAVKYEVRLKDSGEVVATSPAQDAAFALPAPKPLRAFGTAAATMKKGEAARLVVRNSDCEFHGLHLSGAHTRDSVSQKRPGAGSHDALSLSVPQRSAGGPQLHALLFPAVKLMSWRADAVLLLLRRWLCRGEPARKRARGRDPGSRPGSAAVEHSGGHHARWGRCEEGVFAASADSWLSLQGTANLPFGAQNAIN